MTPQCHLVGRENKKVEERLGHGLEFFQRLNPKSPDSSVGPGSHSLTHSRNYSQDVEQKSRSQGKKKRFILYIVLVCFLIRNKK